MKGDNAITELACTATRCSSAGEFRAQAVEWIDRVVGIDGANLVELDGERVESKHTLGLDRAWIDRFHRRISDYRADMTSLMETTARLGGASFGEWSRLEKWAALPGRQGFEEGLAFPVGIRIGSMVVMTVRGRPRAVLFLGRAGRVRIFTPEEGAVLAKAAPVMALGLAVHDGGAAAPPPVERKRAPRQRPLTRRERAVVEFAALGLGNREIGLALGVSPNTVRNQLAGIFEKLGVGSRAELVAVALTEGLVAPRGPARSD